VAGGRSVLETLAQHDGDSRETIDAVVRMWNAGRTAGQISRWLLTERGLNVTDEAVRRWCQENA
jgi:hypothetical protein